MTRERSEVRGPTLLLQHLVSIPDLDVFWKPDCPAEQYLNDSPLNSVRGPGPKVLKRRGNENYRSWKGRSRERAHTSRKRWLLPPPRSELWGGEAGGVPGTSRAPHMATSPGVPLGFKESTTKTAHCVTAYFRATGLSLLGCGECGIIKYICPFPSS